MSDHDFSFDFPGFGSLAAKTQAPASSNTGLHHRPTDRMVISSEICEVTPEIQDHLDRISQIAEEHDLLTLTSPQDPRTRFLDRILEELYKACALSPWRGSFSAWNDSRPMETVDILLNDPLLMEGIPDHPVEFEHPALRMLAERARENMDWTYEYEDDSTPEGRREELARKLRLRRLL